MCESRSAARSAAGGGSLSVSGGIFGYVRLGSDLRWRHRARRAGLSLLSIEKITQTFRVSLSELLRGLYVALSPNGMGPVN